MHAASMAEWSGQACDIVRMWPVAICGELTAQYHQGNLFYLRVCTGFVYSTHVAPGTQSWRGLLRWPASMAEWSGKACYNTVYMLAVAICGILTAQYLQRNLTPISEFGEVLPIVQMWHPLQSWGGLSRGPASMSECSWTLDILSTCGLDPAVGTHSTITAQSYQTNLTPSSEFGQVSQEDPGRRGCRSSWSVIWTCHTLENNIGMTH